jgi:hypothetical protein
VQATILLAAVALTIASPALITAQTVTRTTRGDTTVVATRGLGTWGALRDPVVVARISEDSPESTFGQVFLIAPTPDGGVLVYDMKASEGNIIRQFDANGKFVRNIGRRGGGPGEYNLAGQVVFAAANDGSIVVRDGRRMVNRYSADGRFVNGFAHGYSSTLELYLEANGNIVMRGPFDPRASGRALPPLIRHATDGRVLDTIKAPAPWYAGVATTEYDVTNYWLPYPDGRILQFRSDKLGFLLTDPLGRTKPVMAEVAATPQPYLAAERAELQRVEAWKRANFSPEIQSLIGTAPATKPLVRNFGFTDTNGRIWLQRGATAQKVAPKVMGKSRTDSVMVTYDEPRVFSVFEPDGRYLGDLRFPIGVIPAVVGNTAWAIVPGSEGEPTLVKYRIQP